MLNQPQIKRFSHHLQVSFHHLNCICRHWYRLYAPTAFATRRNINQCKISDSLILTWLIWQVKCGVESQRRFYECHQGQIGLSRSHFNRRARQLLPLIYLIRRALNHELRLNGHFMIIDSFPVPLCQPVRNYRAKIFRGVADIGYKATKKTYFYGFKVHLLVSDDGYSYDYVITKASVHDAKEAFELINNAHLPYRYILGDVGYLGKALHQALKRKGYLLWTPYRHNMAQAKQHNNAQLMAIRRTIESVFNLLSYYNVENNRARSLTGFQECLELTILASNMEYCLERFN